MSLFARRTSLVIFALTLGVLVGCSKSAPPAAPTAAPASPEKSNVASGCEATPMNAMIADITKEENAKSAVEATAKHSPEKGNFRKLYDAEVAYEASMRDRLAKLAGCGAAPSLLEGLKSKIAKSQANLNYLRESFPDFK